MSKTRIVVLSLSVLAVVVSFVVAASGPNVSATQAEPPAAQTYTGAKKCGSCHFTQYMAWKKTNHSKTFDLLTSKYEKDATCLPCHTTGYGEPTGFKDMETTPNLAGNTCESCHGPGSAHEKVAQGFGKKLTPEQEKTVRDSIWLMRPKNVCVTCHKAEGHGKTGTPPELQKK